MAEMMPATIDTQTSNAEKMVFEWFSSDLVKGVVMHSLLQKNHKRKLVAEVDFLYISKRGILCVEVKGGQSILRESGEWYSISKTGVKHNIKDPFRQAMECSYALKDYLMDVYGKFSVEANIIIGYAVVFPECIFTGKGNDLATEVMFDCKSNISDFNVFLEKAFDYWEEQIFSKISLVSNRLTDVYIKKFTNLLRGDFAVVPSIRLEMQHIEQQLITLTEEQFDALETINMNDRVVVTGGAGTGKTLLAIEKARRALAENKKIAFICFNKNISKTVKQAINEDESICFIGTYHNFIRKYLMIDLPNWAEAYELAELFLKNSSETDEFDLIIVDEAQDLMHVSIWESLDKFVKGGMDKGNWILFLDPNQNMFNSEEDYAFAIEYIKEVYSPATIMLTINCRNTEQIGRLTTQITNMPLAKHIKVSGPSVVVDSYTNQKDLLKMVREEMQKLLSGGCLPNEIVILSKYRLENSELAGVEKICNLPIHYAEDITDFSESSLNYFTIQSFKGLEANIVFLIDINGFETLKNRILNYVAATRAKMLLCAFYQIEADDEYQNVIKYNKKALAT
ncbi:MAG: DUF2075 domain-containing protein [Eubacteriaceae bacterium]|nr:DUF2075 domain-containing protein [Eubacteriaceae bacterium]